MPVYTYECEACKCRGDILCSVDERDGDHRCPACGGSLRRRIGAGPTLLSGTGETPKSPVPPPPTTEPNLLFRNCNFINWGTILDLNGPQTARLENVKLINVNTGFKVAGGATVHTHDVSQTFSRRAKPAKLNQRKRKGRKR
jgi:putative FmdB family regulatory protein